jgi:2,3-bisphosphoglycerate-independent phosphoglycerate mutase
MKLRRSDRLAGIGGPVVTVVLDGVGQRAARAGNAVANAYTPTLDRLFASCPHILLKAHGTAVGMPGDEDMGNSEVGHNALGSGQIYSQGASLVRKAIADGSQCRARGRHSALRGTVLRRQRPLAY